MRHAGDRDLHYKNWSAYPHVSSSIVLCCLRFHTLRVHVPVVWRVHVWRRKKCTKKIKLDFQTSDQVNYNIQPHIIYKRWVYTAAVLAQYSLLPSAFVDSDMSSARSITGCINRGYIMAKQAIITATTPTIFRPDILNYSPSSWTSFVHYSYIIIRQFKTYVYLYVSIFIDYIIYLFYVQPFSREKS